MREELEGQLAAALEQCFGAGGDDVPNLGDTITRTRSPEHGDFTTNVAMRLAKSQKKAPRELAADIIAALPPSDLVTKTEVAGPGFINFFLSPAAYHATLRQALTEPGSYGNTEIGRGQRVLVEYVSANPTGPLHVGHGRLAAYGASLSNLLRATGHDVEEEYYVNDAGRQMNILASSLWVRYAQTLGSDFQLPGNAYQGEYVTDMAQAVADAHGDKYRFEDGELNAQVQALDDQEAQNDTLIEGLQVALGEDGFEVFLRGALDPVLTDIKEDLHEFGVRPKNWFSERSLVTDGALQRALDQLKERGLLYVKDGATWFKATQFGDEKDRVVVRENGVSTYFASDIAYHFQKRERGFDLLLDVLGADHHGYVARVRAGLEALGEPGDCLEVRLIQFVALYRGGTKIAMGTRSGKFVSLRELRDEVGNDAARFFYVMRSNDQHLDFDLELAASQSDENPVYYIQYAHARIASILKKVQETYADTLPEPETADFSVLVQPQEDALLRLISRFPEIIDLAATNRAPQHLVHYLRDIAGSFHTYYNAHKVAVDDEVLRQARMLLCRSVQVVIANGLGLLGVSAPETM